MVPAFQFSGIPDDKIGAVSVFNGAAVLLTERPENDRNFLGRLVAETAELRDLAPFGLDAKASSLRFLPAGAMVGDSGTYAVNYDRAGRKGSCSRTSPRSPEWSAEIRCSSRGWTPRR